MGRVWLLFLHMLILSCLVESSSFIHNSLHKINSEIPTKKHEDQIFKDALLWIECSASKKVFLLQHQNGGYISRTAEWVLLAGVSMLGCSTDCLPCHPWRWMLSLLFQFAHFLCMLLKILFSSYVSGTGKSCSLKGSNHVLESKGNIENSYAK